MGCIYTGRVWSVGEIKSWQEEDYHDVRGASGNNRGLLQSGQAGGGGHVHRLRTEIDILSLTEEGCDAHQLVPPSWLCSLGVGCMCGELLFLFYLCAQVQTSLLGGKLRYVNLFSHRIGVISSCSEIYSLYKIRYVPDPFLHDYYTTAAVIWAEKEHVKIEKRLPTSLILCPIASSTYFHLLNLWCGLLDKFFYCGRASQVSGTGLAECVFCSHHQG